VGWTPGQERIRELLEAGALSTVPPDPDLAARMPAVAARHLATARDAASTDTSGAYQIAYDALRNLPRPCRPPGVCGRTAAASRILEQGVLEPW
jgi:hypothetical protein